MTNEEFLKLYGNNKIDKDLLDHYIIIKETSRKDSYFKYDQNYGAIEEEYTSYDDAIYLVDTGELVCWFDHYDHIVNHYDLEVELPDEYKEEYHKLFLKGEYED